MPRTKKGNFHTEAKRSEICLPNGDTILETDQYDGISRVLFKPNGVRTNLGVLPRPKKVREKGRRLLYRNIHIGGSSRLTRFKYGWVHFDKESQKNQIILHPDWVALKASYPKVQDSGLGGGKKHQSKNLMDDEAWPDVVQSWGLDDFPDETGGYWDDEEWVEDPEDNPRGWVYEREDRFVSSEEEQLGYQDEPVFGEDVAALEEEAVMSEEYAVEGHFAHNGYIRY